MLEAVKQPKPLEYAAEALWAEVELVLEAVGQNEKRSGMPLADREFVLEVGKRSSSQLVRSARARSACSRS